MTTKQEMRDKYDQTPFEPDYPMQVCKRRAATQLRVPVDSVYIVMYAYTLGSWKALCSSNQVHGGVYVEVVHNGVKGEDYVVEYREADRRTVK